MKRFIAIALGICLTACQSEPAQNPVVELENPSTKPAELPLRQHFACLPREGAIVAAHRGTSKKADLPENSQSSLHAVINHGILVAEIDVVGLKDGTHVLFHDGVWEEKTTGKGEVAATDWDTAQ